MSPAIEGTDMSEEFVALFMSIFRRESSVEMARIAGYCGA